MQTLKVLGKYSLIVISTAVFLLIVMSGLGKKVNNTLSTINSCLDIPCPLATATVLAQQIGNDPLTKQLQEIDQSLAQSIKSSIAYNAPQGMKLNETATIELLLNPSVEPSTLGNQITEDGQVTTAIIQITPRMKVVLLPLEQDAFLIQSIHDNSEQPISSTETTKWSWNVTAKEGGMQRLTLVIYRLVKVDGKDDWRLVDSYRSDIDIEVTITQRILMLDWKWIVGIIVTALMIPAFWRWMDQRNKQIDQTTTPKRQKKKAR